VESRPAPRTMLCATLAPSVAIRDGFFVSQLFGAPRGVDRGRCRRRRVRQRAFIYPFAGNCCSSTYARDCPTFPVGNGTINSLVRYPRERRDAMATTQARLNRYFAMIDRRVPVKVARSIRWLRKPSSLGIRWVVAILLIIGGIFSFYRY
jgi:hypothetical protein